MPRTSKTKKKKQYGCEQCFGNGYELKPEGKYSVAQVCSCLKCDQCSGTGKKQYYKDSGYSYLKPCEQCGYLHKNVKLYNLAAIPSKYYSVSEVSTFNPRHDTHQDALIYVKQFVDQYPHHKGFLLMGASGLGKTHLAICAISELTLEKGVKCLFVDFFDLLNDLKSAYSEGRPENQVINPLIDTDVLVIDELGKGRANEWELGVLDQLISKRYNSTKITVITTNFVTKDINVNLNRDSKEILEYRVGERISSRLFDMCSFFYLEGRDFRRMNKKN
ncbi:MAG TPA: ATP-binding protein [Thermodesulfobacteriota bacterium]|nr:ATP-binding protein [Thermodesulfobacteriota bacterium]